MLCEPGRPNMVDVEVIAPLIFGVFHLLLYLIDVSRIWCIDRCRFYLKGPHSSDCRLTTFKNIYIHFRCRRYLYQIRDCSGCPSQVNLRQLERVLSPWTFPELLCVMLTRNGSLTGPQEMITNFYDIEYC